ncbi:putative ferric-chelate reductase 1 isoform X2 [Pseudoliparis swirei]|uniref:putative ferric-chelate reductase 1 isoform X2 n=1 Tax=Pseudoliparis swirei TaxID=2059687 RepID=UPI0024BEBF63|nr:putative ferric-chelate reductase 1 isoform X2 [Pseudoliparis swirei]
MRLGVAALLVAVCVCRVQQCVCFPNGSVAFSCGSMAPSHPPYTASTSSPPFTLSTSSATYRPGGVITEEVWPVGSFTNISRSLFTALHCNNMQNSTVSQASGVKKKKVQVMWEAPSNSNYRDVYFSATLVQDYTTFWVQMKSRTMTLDSSSAAGVRFMYLLMC